MNGWDISIKGISEVGIDLGVTPLVEVRDRVIARVTRVVLGLVMLESASEVVLIIGLITIRGIFYL